MKLQPLASRAAPSLAVAEGALLLVADPHRALDRIRNRPRRRRRVALSGRLARCLRGGEASPLELADQQRHGAVEHRTEVAIGDPMAQQRPRPLDLAVKVLAGRELHPIPCWRDRHHHVRPASRPRRGERRRWLLHRRCGGRRRSRGGLGCRGIHLPRHGAGWGGGESRKLARRDSVRNEEVRTDGEARDRRIGQASHARRNIWPRRELGHEKLDLALRSVGGPPEQGLGVVLVADLDVQGAIACRASSKSTTGVALTFKAPSGTTSRSMLRS